MKIPALMLSLFAAVAVAPVHAAGQTAAPKVQAATPTSCPAVLHQSFKRLQDDVPQDLCQYAGMAARVAAGAAVAAWPAA